jgi:hypothetical protein
VDDQHRHRPEARGVGERLAAGSEAAQGLGGVAKPRRPTDLPQQRCAHGGSDRRRERVRRHHARLGDQQRQSADHENCRATDNQAGPGEGEIEVRVGKDLRQLG